MDEMERRERRRRKTLGGASLDASRVEIWKDILKLDGELLEKLSECFPSYPDVPTGSEDFGSHIAKFLNSTFGRLSAKPHPSLKPLQTPDGPAVTLHLHGRRTLNVVCCSISVKKLQFAVQPKASRLISATMKSP